jgi:hypothetical protein
MTASEFLKMMDPKTWEFIISDNPEKTPDFYWSVYTIVLHRWPEVKKHLIATV